MAFTPKQIVHAYGFDQIKFKNGTVPGDGSGQTIALVDAYYDPTIKSDITTFSSTYGLAPLDGKNGDGTFTQLDLTGNKVQSPAGDDWTLETALDVEWAHAVAPKANILLVEAKSDITDPNTGEPTDLLNAVHTAATTPGVRAVSMSWGIGEVPAETNWDSFFSTPQVTFLAASGDSGAGTIWPAVSPNVVAVGGTTLRLTSTNTISSETGWGNGPFSFFFGGSGGGFSQHEALPSYQSNISTVSNGFKLTSFGVRLNPDVAYVADPNTGVRVLDGADGGWFTVGGTSAGAPQWAGLIAIADQGRALAGKTPLSSTQTLSAIYSSGNASGFHDITKGSSTGAYDVVDNNGNIIGTITVAPGTGYDMVTGVGSPVANVLVADLVTVASASAVKTAAVASPAATGSAGSKSSGKAGAKDMPSNNNTNSGTTTTSTNLAAQQLLAQSLTGLSVGLLSASAVPPTPATGTAIQPVPTVQPASSAGLTALLSRYTGITGGGDRLDDGLTTPEEPCVPPAAPQEDRANSVMPAGPAVPTEDATSKESMSRARLDAYFIAVSVAEDLPVRTPVPISTAEERATAAEEMRAGMGGLIALLGGFWTIQGPRAPEESKRKDSGVPVEEMF
jgi:subtilase family serine protease